MNKILQGITGLLHILYPVRCPICDGVLDTLAFDGIYPICQECKSKMEYVKEPVCKKCGKPLTNQRKEYCQDCIRHEHFFVQGKALLVYQGQVKESMYRLKYGNRREYAVAYAQEMAKQYGGWIKRKKIGAIVPIPLHKKRQRQRGYNQAQIIAGELGKQLGIPVRNHWLKRTIHTKPQKELNDKERKENLKKAFLAVEEMISEECILLVDDIFTTGSTIDGAAKALREAGAKEIYFISISIGRGFA